MKKYRRMWLGVILLFVLIFLGSNGWIMKSQQEKSRGYCQVEIERIVKEGERQENFPLDLDVSRYKYVKNIERCDSEEALVKETSHPFVIKKIGDTFYRIEYELGKEKNTTIIVVVNLVLGGCFFLINGILSYLYYEILKPFHEMEELPVELAKGNLTTNLEEHRSKYFSKYIWGTTLLRESIEEQKKRELDLHRERKMLLLSLTHDIKTPLSVIKLNTQALQRGLYKEEERRMEAVNSIGQKVDEIENYVTQLIQASKEEFLSLDVVEEEFYLSHVMESIEKHYSTKMELNKTRFTIETYDNLLLTGDERRLVEVIQNLLDNALKYGDGEEIRICVNREEDCLLISVENTGEPIRTEEFLHLFDSFYRGSNVGNQTGSGLGLYICRCLMNKMNGDIFAKQENGWFKMTIVLGC